MSFGSCSSIGSGISIINRVEVVVLFLLLLLLFSKFSASVIDLCCCCCCYSCRLSPLLAQFQKQQVDNNSSDGSGFDHYMLSHDFMVEGFWYEQCCFCHVLSTGLNKNTKTKNTERVTTTVVEWYRIGFA